tara:strand:+ start:814 stop:1431 length:618 start_codon:yes stop_codon:yes gene_type:complete
MPSTRKKSSYGFPTMSKSNEQSSVRYQYPGFYNLNTPKANMEKLETNINEFEENLKNLNDIISKQQKKTDDDLKKLSDRIDKLEARKTIQPPKINNPLRGIQQSNLVKSKTQLKKKKSGNSITSGRSSPKSKKKEKKTQTIKISPKGKPPSPRNQSSAALFPGSKNSNKKTINQGEIITLQQELAKKLKRIRSAMTGKSKDGNSN